MDTSFKKNQEELIDTEDKKIEFAGKSGEDLNKKDLRQPSTDKKVEDIYDFRDKGDSTKESVEKEKSEPVISEEPIPVKKDFLVDFFQKIKKNLTKNQKKEDDGILEVNLVKEEIVKYFDWQKGIFIFLLALLFSLFFLSIGYWGISWWSNKKQVSGNSSYTQEYFKVSKEIKELEPQVEEVLSFKNKLDLSNSLLNSHIYWTNFFDFLENNTLSDVYFSSFSGDIGGDYVFSATSDSVDAVNVQIKKLLENPYVKNAQVDSTDISSNEKGLPKISFKLGFLLDPHIFLKNSDIKE